MMPRFCRQFGIALGLALLALVPALGGADGQVPRATASAWSAEGRQVAHRLLRDIEEAVDRVEPWLQRYGYGAVFALVGVEGCGVPAPGQTILEAGAVAAAAPDARLQIGWLLLVAFLAAALGNTLGYWIGRAGGRPLLRRLRISERHLGRVETGFDRYGGWLIVFARFFDGPRQLNGIAAGFLEMPWARFTVFNLVGAALWVSFWGLGVYYIDLHLDGLVGLIRRINPWTAAATVSVLGALAVLYWLKSYRGGNPRA